MSKSAGMVLSRHVPPDAGCQAEPPEEDMDVRGGGAAADDARIVKPGYESDDEGDEPKRWAGYHTASAPGGHMVSPSASYLCRRRQT